MTNSDSSVESLPRLIGMLYAPSRPLEECLAFFWGSEVEGEAVEIKIEPPDVPLEFLERLGPSPFERGAFPLIGFLATTYDKVSRYALERAHPAR